MTKEIKVNNRSSSLNVNNKKNELLDKIRRKLNNIIVNKIENTGLQFKAYNSYWHYYFLKRSNKKSDINNNNIYQDRYLCLKPNYGAGIGHQLANWNAGLYFAGYYRLEFAHFPFSTEKWESFLGFGENEIKAADLINDNNYKKVRLPRFNSDNQNEIDLVGDIIASYRRSKVLFILEMDQSYMRQYETNNLLSDKFFKAAARSDDKLIYDRKCFNIAIHIRRGDIVAMKQGGVANWKDRWLDNQYYVDVLKKVLDTIKITRPVSIFLFSQGNLEDFNEFNQFDNLIYCLQMGPMESFLHMVNADLLISSKSSFSYKPTLISKGIKICPGSFWHQYPATNDYILVNDNGDFNEDKLSSLMLLNL